MRYVAQFLLASAALIVCASSFAQTDASCESVPAAMKLGPTLTIGEVDVFVSRQVPSLNQAIQSPQAFQLQARWSLLKERMQPGDEVHKYTSNGSGGFAVTRKACLIAIFGTWVK